MKKNNLLNGLYLYLGASLGYTLLDIGGSVMYGLTASWFNLLLFPISPLGFIFHFNPNGIDATAFLGLFGALIGYLVTLSFIKTR